MREGRRPVMTLDTLLILAEYFSHKKEVDFALLLSEENNDDRLVLAVCFNEASLLIRPSGIREIEISKELICLMGGKLVFVRSIKGQDGPFENSIFRTWRPVFCRNEDAYDEFLEKIPGRFFQNNGSKYGFWNSGKGWN
jgi:hypothetical protein